MNTNRWLQIHIGLDSAASDCVSDCLTEKGALAITITPAEDRALFQYEPGDMPLWDKITMTVLFPVDGNADKIMATLVDREFIHSNTAWRHEILEEKDWVHETQKEFPATCFADRFWIVPSWDKGDYPDPKIFIDPGLAFGTGTHPTTALCLEWLALNPLNKKTVIDFGCGSGILSLAACALGATDVYAIDHDDQAVLATNQNRQLNEGLINQLTVGKADALPADLCAEVVIANILAKPLLDLYPTLVQHTQPAGTLILSGLLESDYDMILERYQPAFTLTDKANEGEWLRLTFIKE
jgi:ribosomal protein L11 methyltransferase